MILLGLTLILGVSSGLAAEIEGNLRERGTRKPLGEINIYLIAGEDLKSRPAAAANTDQGGDFVIGDLKPGTYTLIANATGYEKLVQKIDLKEESRTLTLFLERESYSDFETTVYGKFEKRDEVLKTLTQEEFLKAPGAGSDPVRAVQNLPGVARAAALSPTILIQGSGPTETQYQIDGHEVPIIFHFGGLTSVTFPESVARVDFLTAGYGPENGRATGGLVNLQLKSPAKDRWHGILLADILNAGVLVEGPISENQRFLSGFRQAYIGAILRVALSGMDGLDLTAVPSYTDWVTIYEWDISKRHRFRSVSIASFDTLNFLFTEPLDTNPAVRGNFENKTRFFRIIPQYEFERKEGSVFRTSLGFGPDALLIRPGEGNELDIRAWVLSTRGEWEERWTPYYRSFLGWDHVYNFANVSADLPRFSSSGGVADPIDGTDRLQTQVRDRVHALALYIRNEFTLKERWSLQPNFRLAYFKQTGSVEPEPRALIRYAFDDQWSVAWSGGLFHQAPEPAETDATFGNPDLKPIRAYHSNLTVVSDFRKGGENGLRVQSGFFYKHLDRLVTPSQDTIERDGELIAENFSNSESGRAFGGEARIRYNWDRLRLETFYTLSKSERWNPIDGRYRFEFDQTHLLGLIAAYQYKGWEFSTRFRYATGNTFTPVNGGIFDSDQDSYRPLRGDVYSARNPAFMQLDLRIDRKFVFDRWILSLYLEILNLTNRANPEGRVYSYDYAESERITGLPIVPIFGLKGEF